QVNEVAAAAAVTVTILELQVRLIHSFYFNSSMHAMQCSTMDNNGVFVVMGVKERVK
ncbi:unnamed protein product, partial [Musa acuminata subsp. burmannicoides]